MIEILAGGQIKWRISKGCTVPPMISLLFGENACNPYRPADAPPPASVTRTARW
jgi:hypothetical protein